MKKAIKPPKRQAKSKDEFERDADNKSDIQMFGSLYVIAHTLIEWDVERLEQLIHLTEMLEGEEDELRRGVMIETLAHFTFMHTKEFMDAFREYRFSITSPLNPFWQERGKGGEA